MSLVKVQGNVSGTGVFTVAAPNSNTDRTLTLPDETGTILTNSSTTVIQKGTPAFSAYQSANITITTATWTKAQINTEEFDTNSNFDTSNYRFTPTVAGYYQVNGCADLYTSSAGTMSSASIGFYKNGSFFKFCSIPYAGGALTEIVLTTSALIYMNGSTDYLELYVRASASGTITSYGNVNNSTFSASLVRAA